MSEKIPVEICELYNRVNEKIEMQKPDKSKKVAQRKVKAWIDKVSTGKFPYVDDMVLSAQRFVKDDITPDKEELKRLRTKKRALEALYPELKN